MTESVTESVSWVGATIRFLIGLACMDSCKILTRPSVLTNEIPEVFDNPIVVEFAHDAVSDIQDCRVGCRCSGTEDALEMITPHVTVDVKDIDRLTELVRQFLNHGTCAFAISTPFHVYVVDGAGPADRAVEFLHRIFNCNIIIRHVLRRHAS